MFVGTLRAEDRTVTTIVNHENLARIQRGWDALAHGDPAPAFESMAADVVLENGPLPGPTRWVRCEGRETVAAMLAGQQALFGGTLRQTGTCLHADERVAVSVVRDEGVLGHARYATDVITVMRFDHRGDVDRLWFVEIDVERVAEALGRVVGGG
jgi:ketosteroid isomerase-like protein